MRPGDKAWLALGVGVLSYDALCGDGETMSETADAYMLSRPWLVRAIAFAVAAHVANAIPSQVDPIHGLFALSRKWRRP